MSAVNELSVETQGDIVGVWLPPTDSGAHVYVDRRARNVVLGAAGPRTESRVDNPALVFTQKSTSQSATVQLQVIGPEGTPVFYPLDPAKVGERLTAFLESLREDIPLLDVPKA